MKNVPGPSEKDPAEGSRDIVERELRRADGRNTGTPAGQRNTSMNAGDDAPVGTVGTGEALCPECRGTGRRGAESCPNCGGSGKIVQAIGGG
jgi:hypothetical protein